MSTRCRQWQTFDDDDMIEELATDGTDQPLNERILPRRSRSRNDFLDAHVLDSLVEELVVDRSSMSGLTSYSLFPAKTHQKQRIKKTAREWAVCFLAAGIFAPLGLKAEQPRMHHVQRSLRGPTQGFG